MLDVVKVVATDGVILTQYMILDISQHESNSAHRYDHRRTQPRHHLQRHSDDNINCATPALGSNVSLQQQRWSTHRRMAIPLELLHELHTDQCGHWPWPCGKRPGSYGPHSQNHEHVNQLLSDRARHLGLCGVDYLPSADVPWRNIAGVPEASSALRHRVPVPSGFGGSDGHRLADRVLYGRTVHRRVPPVTSRLHVHDTTCAHRHCEHFGRICYLQHATVVRIQTTARKFRLFSGLILFRFIFSD